MGDKNLVAPPRQHDPLLGPEKESSNPLCTLLVIILLATFMTVIIAFGFTKTESAIYHLTPLHIETVQTCPVYLLCGYLDNSLVYFFSYEISGGEYRYYYVAAKNATIVETNSYTQPHLTEVGKHLGDTPRISSSFTFYIPKGSVIANYIRIIGVVP